MFTETEKEKDEWIGAVGRYDTTHILSCQLGHVVSPLLYVILFIRSIVKHSSMYVKDDDDSEEESDEEESDEN